MIEPAAPVRVSVRFYAELNDFLPAQRRHQTLELTLRERDSVKDVIESAGVPHTEVDLVLAAGESVDFGYRVRDGDRISVYPAFRTLDVAAETRVRPPALAEARFVLDIHLGRLATQLRLLGFDCLYWNDADDPTLARVSQEEERILLTRDRGLLKRRNVTYGYHVWETNPERQVLEVLRRFRLFDAVRPFSRCLHCNGPVRPVSKEAVLDRLEPKTRLYYDEFGQCAACERVYWKGSHYGQMASLVARYGGNAQTTAR